MVWGLWPIALQCWRWVRSEVEPWHVIALGLLIAAGGLIWQVYSPPPRQNTATTTAARTGDQPDTTGPLIWYYDISPGDGPSIRFRGVNASQNEVRLKSADIRSAVTGEQLALQVDVGNPTVGIELVPVDKVQLIPPQARIYLVADFSAFGMDMKAFLDNWRQFSFNVTDGTRSYRLDFTQEHLARVFPGMIGPRVTKAPERPQGASDARP
jgi:hypothetical protein